MSTIEYILIHSTPSHLFFPTRHIEEKLLITPPVYLTAAELYISISVASHTTNNYTTIQQPGVPDTKTNPKGIGEVNEYL